MRRWDVIETKATTRIDHELHGLQPVLPVRDVGAATAYYRDVLGFEVDFLWGEPPTHGRVVSGGWDTGGPVYIQFSLVSSDGPERQSSARLRIHVGVDVDGLCAEYRARGAAILGDPVSEPWGLREFEVRDPDGHILGFCGYLGDRRSVPDTSVR